MGCTPMQQSVHILWGGSTDPQQFVHILGGGVGGGVDFPALSFILGGCPPAPRLQVRC